MAANVPGATNLTPSTLKSTDIVAVATQNAQVAQATVAVLLAGPSANRGTVTLNGATPVTVTNTNVTANSSIILTLKTVGGTVSPNAPNILTITPATGFTVAGTALDTSVYNYQIIG